MSLSKLTSGDVVRINLEPAVGQEQKNHGKSGRPCVVVSPSHRALNLIIVVPITDAQGKLNNPNFVEIKDLKSAQLDKPSVIDPYQIRAVDKNRCVKILGAISKQELVLVRQLIALYLEIESIHLK